LRIVAASVLLVLVVLFPWCHAKSDNYQACLTASDARHKPAR
jgi:uncharacterized membrane protein YjgN (DUF898 family)